MNHSTQVYLLGQKIGSYFKVLKLNRNLFWVQDWQFHYVYLTSLSEVQQKGKAEPLAKEVPCIISICFFQMQWQIQLFFWYFQGQRDLHACICWELGNVLHFIGVKHQNWDLNWDQQSKLTFCLWDIICKGNFQKGLKNCKEISLLPVMDMSSIYCRRKKTY